MPNVTSLALFFVADIFINMCSLNVFFNDCIIFHHVDHHLFNQSANVR